MVIIENDIVFLVVVRLEWIEYTSHAKHHSPRSSSMWKACRFYKNAFNSFFVQTWCLIFDSKYHVWSIMDLFLEEPIF